MDNEIHCHIEVEGVAWCARVLDMDINMRMRSASRAEDIPLICTHKTQESAERMAALLDSVGLPVNIVSGNCPVPKVLFYDPEAP